MWLSQNVKHYTEILGVIMNNEFKWNNHVYSRLHRQESQ